MMNGITGLSGYGYYANTNAIGNTLAAVNDADNNRTNRVDSSGECQTCKNRKYQDGSNENVSFKSAAHVAPQAAAGAIRAHEGEHVSNAYTKAAENNGKVVNASVTIHTSICPECGKSYVSGGTTNTTIKYANESNPYVKNLKAQQADSLKGQFVDVAA